MLKTEGDEPKKPETREKKARWASIFDVAPKIRTPIALVALLIIGLFGVNHYLNPDKQGNTVAIIILVSILIILVSALFYLSKLPPKGRIPVMLVVVLVCCFLLYNIIQLVLSKKPELIPVPFNFGVKTKDSLGKVYADINTVELTLETGLRPISTNANSDGIFLFNDIPDSFHNVVVRLSLKTGRYTFSNEKYFILIRLTGTDTTITLKMVSEMPILAKKTFYVLAPHVTLSHGFLQKIKSIFLVKNYTQAVQSPATHILAFSYNSDEVIVSTNTDANLFNIKGGLFEIKIDNQPINIALQIPDLPSSYLYTKTKANELVNKSIGEIIEKNENQILSAIKNQIHE